MAGGNAVIRIDSFVGGALPPKAFIKLIRIMRDTFPAENHSAEHDGIDIITQAGVGVIRGGLSTRRRQYDTPVATFTPPPASSRRCWAAAPTMAGT